MTSHEDSHVYLWLDGGVDAIEDNLEIQQELRQITKQFRTFTSSESCEEYIRKAEQEKIFLIVSGSLGRKIIPKIHHLPQLIAFYVFCGNKAANEWAKTYNKIKDIVTQRDHLIKRILEDQVTDNRTNDDVLISVISYQSENLQARNAKFMWFQLFIEVLLRMHHKSVDRKELIDLCRKTYVHNPEQLQIIDDFEKNYDPETAVSWYTRHSCLYRMMNKALRTQHFETLFIFRFFITDIAKQIKREHERFIRNSTTRNIITVYRGQLINTHELELMKNNIGEYLSMNSFLSTSKDRTIALSFAEVMRRSDVLQPILFEIEINPKLRTKHFADISQLSSFHEEHEVLIMIGALFRINKVIEDVENRRWIAKVSLADEDDYHLKEILSHMKEKIGDDTNLDTLGKLLLRMDENEQARKCYKRLLEETQLAVGDARLGLGWASMRCKYYKESLEHFEESLHLRRQLLGENHPSVAESLSFIGEVYRNKRNYEQALIELNKAKEIYEVSLGSNSLDLAATYDTIANTYTALSQYDAAFEYFKKALHIRQNKLPANHPQLAALYNNMAWAYESSANYTKSLEYYKKSLSISVETLPPTHRHVVEAEKQIKKLQAIIKESDA